ncbi:MAG: hypothetical protein HZA50_02810 [Planctomycetes bacterium]|nr:hypothetical protein [Planctomycetota bacterium]
MTDISSENVFSAPQALGPPIAAEKIARFRDDTPATLRWAARSIIILCGAVLALGATVLLLLPIAGCGNPQLGGLAWMFRPILPKKKVPAEFSEFPNSTVAIVVYPRESIEVEYPSVKLTLAWSVAAYLKPNVKNIKIVDPRTVMKFQEENLDWLAMSRKELGRKLGADYILFIALQNYTTREDGSRDSFRGRIAAEASVFRTSNSSDTPVWQAMDMRAAHPGENEPLLLLPDGDDSKVRERVEGVFAEQLARKFYTYKEEWEE